MKKWIACAASLLLVAGCNRNKSGDSNDSQNAPTTIPAEVTAEAIDPDRLGFATRLPESAEFYIALHNPGEVLNALLKTDVGERLSELDDSEASTAESREEIMAKIKEVMVGDAFLCIDQGVAWQIDAIGGFYQDMSAVQVKLVSHILLRALNDLGKGDISIEDGAYADLVDAYGDEAAKLFTVLIGQVDANLEKIQVPSVYVGCSPPEGKTAEWLGVWSESIKSACEEKYIEPHGFEKYGTQFSGFRINLGSMMEDVKVNEGEDTDSDEESRLPDVAVDAVERITEKLKTMSITVVCGEVDGHILIYAGPDSASLILADEVENSLASRSEFEQFEDMDDARLLGVCYASEPFLESFQTWRGYEKTYRALAEVFGNGILPESKKIAGKFEALASLEHELTKCEIDPFLMICALDKGLRIETVGGRHDQSLDYEKPLQLPALTDHMGDELFMRMHWMEDRARKEKQLDYAELLVGAAGQILESCFLAFEDENGDGVEWYEKSKKMYEEVLDPELTRLWMAYRKSFRPSLGSEVAIMMDINGEMPRVLGVPSRILKEGRIPRILYVRPVEDRAELEAAYGALETTTKNLLEYASILAETELPMPDFLSAQKDDLTTWFYPFPTLTNDFVPGVSVSDTLFMVGSSKNFAESTYATWKSGNTTQRDYTGMMIDIQFKPLWDVTGQWIDLVEKEKAETKPDEKPEVTKDDGEAMDSDEDEVVDYESARKVLQGMRSLESFHWHRRKENRAMRSTIRVNVGSK